jgi:hypothetical protein
VQKLNGGWGWRRARRTGVGGSRRRGVRRVSMAATGRATRSGLRVRTLDRGKMGALTGGSGATVPRFDLIQSRSNPFKQFNKFEFKIYIGSNFILSKQDLPKLEKIEIKYDSEGLDDSNNFTSINFFRFEINFKLKFGKSIYVFDFRKLIKISRNGQKIQEFA